MPTCQMCNAEVEDIGKHNTDSHGDSGGGDDAPAEGGDAEK